MVKVTDKEYYMEPRLKEKLDLMIERCTGKRKMDNLLIVDGDEGYGKSTFATQVAYYFSHKTGRPFSVNNMFFNIDKLIDTAVSSKDQIFVWDEAALGGLSVQWQSKIQQKLVQLLMVARKKRHFFIFNIPKFFKLNEYILVDRAIAMVHVYARQEKELGRFVYYNKKSKEYLYYNFRKKRERAYKKFKTFRGTFPNVMGELIDEDAYDRKKDRAIMSIAKDAETNKWKIKYLKLYHKISMFCWNLKDEHNISLRKIEKLSEFERHWITKGLEIPDKYPEIYKYNTDRSHSGLRERGKILLSGVET